MRGRLFLASALSSAALITILSSNVQADHLECRYYSDRFRDADRDLEAFNHGEHAQALREYNQVLNDLEYGKNEPGKLRKKIDVNNKESAKIRENYAEAEGKIQQQDARAKQFRADAAAARTRGDEKTAKKLEGNAREVEKNMQHLIAQNKERQQKIRENDDQNIRHEESIRKIERDYDLGSLEEKRKRLEEQNQELTAEQRRLRDAVRDAKSTLELCLDYECQSRTLDAINDTIRALKDEGCSAREPYGTTNCEREGYRQAMRSFGCTY